MVGPHRLDGVRAQVGRAVAALPARVTAAAFISLTAVVLALGVLATTADRTPASGSDPGGGRPARRITSPSPFPARTTLATTTTTRPSQADGSQGTAFLVLTLVFLVAVALVALSFVVVLAVVAHRLVVAAFDAGRVGVVHEDAGLLVGGRPQVEQDLDDRLRARRRALERTTVRGAIVACWADLEDAAAQAGHPRSEHETSRELASRLRALPGVDAAALETLRSLFAEARFSEHELPESDRDRALLAVERLETDLRAAPGRIERQSAR